MKTNKFKNSVFLIFTCFITVSCFTLKKIPLKGRYVNEPYIIISEKPYDEVWSNTIDLFTTQGLSIKLLDKSSGLIVSEKTSFLNDYTFEDKNGDLENPDASIVIEKYTYKGNNKPVIKPEELTGEWNIRIKNTGNGKTEINVNLTNANGSTFIAGSDFSAPEIISFVGKSTGNFEETVSKTLKK